MRLPLRRRGEEISSAAVRVHAFTNPPQTYAVFEQRDHISAIAEAWKAIWEHGLADAGFQAADGPALERYGEEFDGRTGLGGYELWVPIKS